MNPTASATTTCWCRPSVETLVTERHAAARAPTRRERRSLARGLHPRSRRHRAARRPAVRALLQRVDARERPGRRRDRRRDRAGAGRPARASGPDDDGRRRRRAGPRGRRAPDLPRRRGPDEPLARSTSAAPRSSCQPVHALRGHAPRPTAGLHRTPRRRSSPSGSTSGSPTRCARPGVDASRPGRFGAEMAVELVNDGPFTIWLDSADR